MCVLFGSSDIFFGVADIVIAHNNHVFFFLVMNICNECIVEIELVSKHFCAISSCSAIWEVDIEEQRIAKACFCDSSIIVKHAMGEGVGSCVWDIFGEKSCPSISSSCPGMSDEMVS